MIGRPNFFSTISGGAGGRPLLGEGVEDSAIRRPDQDQSKVPEEPILHDRR